MCEFIVYLNGKKVMEDVIFAQVNEEGVVVKDIIGESKLFQRVKIAEVNVLSTKLILDKC